MSIAESIETLTDRMKTWLSIGASPIPRKYLDRYERQQTHHPGHEARRKIAKINPETHIKLLLTRCAMLSDRIEKVLEADISVFTADDARTILSILNSIPLVTQYLCSAVALRINTAMGHVASFHNDRRRIDKWQRGNVLKRAVWRYKFSKGKRLPAEAALWERGYISRVAVRQSRKMPKILRRFMKEAWKTKMLSGRCVYWLKMMGAQEGRSEKVFYDVDKKEWGTIEAPIIAPTEFDNAESEEDDEEDDESVEGDAMGEEETKVEQVKETKAELPKGGSLQHNTEQRSVLESVSEVEEHETEEQSLGTTPDAGSCRVAKPSKTELTAGQNTARPQSRHSKEIDPDDSEPESPTIRLETIEENREEEEEAEESYLRDQAAKAKAAEIKAAKARAATTQPTTTSNPSSSHILQSAQPKEPPPDYYDAYFHPHLTDSQVALYHTEHLKSTVQREQLWNPPPRYLDPESQRFCMHVDSKWHIRAPRMDEQTVLKRRRGEETARRREAREKYERETPLWRQWGDSYKAWREGKGKGRGGEEEKEEWVDEKSEAYAHTIEMTMMFGRGQEAEGPRSGSHSPPESDNKEAKSSVGVRQSGIHVQRRISIRRCRLTRPCRTTTKTTIQTTNHTPTSNTTIFTLARHTLSIRPRRLRHEAPIPGAIPKVFTPSPENLQQLQKAVKKLLKQVRRDMLDSHTRMSRFMDVWEECADSGQAWRWGKDRMAPGFAEGLRGY